MDNGRQPSKHQPPEREVTFITPVLYSHHIPATITPRTLSYRKDELLQADQTVLPASVEELPHGMVIELPEVATAQYVAGSLSWLPIADDTALARRLLDLMRGMGGEAGGARNSAKGVDILSSALFLSADSET